MLITLHRGTPHLNAGINFWLNLVAVSQKVASYGRTLRGLGTRLHKKFGGPVVNELYNVMWCMCPAIYVAIAIRTATTECQSIMCGLPL